MTSIRKVALACVASAMMALPLTAAAQVGPRNQDTFFTFSQAVELPNKTLAGIPTIAAASIVLGLSLVPFLFVVEARIKARVAGELRRSL